jgi:hypothetical protein
MFLTGLVMVLSKSSRDEIILTANNHTVLLGLISLLVGLPIIILHNMGRPLGDSCYVNGVANGT